MKRAVAGLLVLSATLGVAAGCRCYHVGNQFSWRSDIRTVHVGIFDSDSYRRFSGQRVTEAVIREIGLRTPLTITEPAVADSFVQGRIVRDQKQVLGENRFDEPRTIGYGWVMEVTWVDRAGQPLMQRQLIQINDDVSFIPEGGQSLGSAELELVESLARQVVGQMEMPW
jgi:Lipopolysaccharide-assembly